VSVDVAARLVDYYLTKLHNRPHSLFHPATLKKQVQDGSINKALLLSICSMGARFDTDDEIRSLENTYSNESKRLLLADLENICIENVQTCILIANLYAAHLNPSSEALFFRKRHQKNVLLCQKLTVHRYRRQLVAYHGCWDFFSGQDIDRSRDKDKDVVDAIHG
jgi:hypothetical protein